MVLWRYIIDPTPYGKAQDEVNDDDDDEWKLWFFIYKTCSKHN